MTKIGMLTGAVLAFMTTGASGAVVVSYNAGVNTTLAAPTAAGYAVETFEAAAPGVNETFSQTINGVTFAYSGVNVIAANDAAYGQYGNGTNYASAYSGVGPAGATSSYRLDVTGGTGTYFGAFIGAADAVNTITFDLAGGGTYVYTPTGPNAPANQGSTFVNFTFTGGERYTGLTVSTTAGTGFETDNHTVAGAVPEVATWAMLLVGFGAVGGVMRRQRPAPQTAL